MREERLQRTMKEQREEHVRYLGREGKDGREWYQCNICLTSMTKERVMEHYKEKPCQKARISK